MYVAAQHANWCLFETAILRCWHSAIFFKKPPQLIDIPYHIEQFAFEFKWNKKVQDIPLCVVFAALINIVIYFGKSCGTLNFNVAKTKLLKYHSFNVIFAIRFADNSWSQWALRSSSVNKKEKNFYNFCETNLFDGASTQFSFIGSKTKGTRSPDEMWEFVLFLE